MPVPKRFIDQIRKLIPPLDGSLHKGQSGRVGVLGGALDNVGSATSAFEGYKFVTAAQTLRQGADLSHVICSPTAAGAIKTYSPDIIVHPILAEETSKDAVTEELKSLFSRLHVLILGPGLGREPYMQSHARTALSIAQSKGMFVVLDADALFLVSKDTSVISGYRRAVLTPNVVEFKRLSEALGLKADEASAESVSKALGGVTVLQKGSDDVIAADTSGKEASTQVSKIQDDQGVQELVTVDIEGSPRRCGGQGDILSGSVGTFLSWGKCFEDGAFGDKSVPVSQIPLLAAIGGSMLTRTVSKAGFAKHGRSLITQDLLQEIGPALAELFEAQESRL